MSESKMCPCGSDKVYSSCCEQYHKNQSLPQTAEILMRARYSAYVKQEIDFVWNTHHSSTRAELDREAIETWSMNSEWLGLEITKTLDGGPDDIEGTVDFIARYESQGKACFHHEHSFFLREDGVWFYKDGKTLQNKPIKREDPKIGRNDPCDCGSGKKFKKCCLGKQGKEE